jgi:membrane protease subunit (stomatin/prohibitin family)
MMRRRGGVARTIGRTAVVAGTATAVAGGVSRRQSKKAAAEQNTQAANQQAAYDQGQADAQAAPPAAPSQGSELEELQRLADMKAQGLINDAEYTAAKAKLLGL